jgi:hypothetical protein
MKEEQPKGQDTSVCSRTFLDAIASKLLDFPGTTNRRFSFNVVNIRVHH